MSATQEGHEISVQQLGYDCKVTICGETRYIRNCDSLKLAATLFNKRGVNKYTEKEMYDLGFGLK